MKKSIHPCKIATAIAVLSLSLAAPALRADEPDASRTAKDANTSQEEVTSISDFLSEAAQGGLAEVKLGQIAQERGQSAAVKEFGRRLVSDHSKANEELKQLAQKKGIEVPKTLDEKHSKVVDQFSRLSGEQFDRAFAHHAIVDHEKDIKKFEAQAKNSQDSDLKAFATKTLPTLRDHLKMAQALPSSHAAGSVDAGTVIHEPAGAQKSTQPSAGNLDRSNKSDKSTDNDSASQNRDSSSRNSGQSQNQK